MGIAKQKVGKPVRPSLSRLKAGSRSKRRKKGEEALKKTYLVQLFLYDAETLAVTVEYRVLRSTETAEQIRETCQVSEGGYAGTLVTELICLAGTQTEHLIPEGTLLPSPLPDEKIRKLLPELWGEIQEWRQRRSEKSR